MEKQSRIYIAGHSGMVGSMLVKELQARGFANLILRSRDQLNLFSQKAVADFFAKEKPEYVFLAAARVGGFKAITDYAAEFLYENLQIQNNVIWSAHEGGVKKLLFLSSSCVYPSACKQPMREEYLMDGKVDPTNEAYAIAKISGMELCRMISRQYNKNFISCVPTNIYGEKDSFNPDSARIVAALIRRFDEAKETNKDSVTVWGTGRARRELLDVKDLAEACIFLMQNFNFSDGCYFVNVGTGVDITIKSLAVLIKKIVGFKGEICWDESKPEGMKRKLLDVSMINQLGWRHKISPTQGIARLYQWYKKSF